MPKVELNEVSRSFGGAHAVRNVTTTIPDGAFVSLLGPSGCGKTTTLRMIAGLETNTGGTISIGDRVVSDASRGFFVAPENRNAGMVFQSYAIWPHMTVFDNVAYPLRLRKFGRAEIHDKVMRALDLVEMKAFADRPAPQLSGGQQQRVAIARAVTFEPSVLLLDEPLSNLDARLRDQMRIELRAMQQRLNITTVFVTHDQEEAMSLSDRIIVMRRGEILQQDTPQAVYFRPADLDVANFCSTSTIVLATVIRSDMASPSSHVLQVEGDGWTGRVLSATRIAPGRSVSVIIRAETVKVDGGADRDGADHLIFWRGRVEKNIFRGFRRTLIVRSGEVLFTVDTSPEHDFPIDHRVSLSVSLKDTWSVPGPVRQAAASVGGGS